MTVLRSGYAQDRRRRAVGLLAAFVAISLFTRWLSLRIEILDIDESAHIAGSWELLRGGLLYTDFVDNKPPLLYVYYALAQLVFGRGMIAVHLLTALVTVPLTALAWSAFYRHDAMFYYFADPRPASRFVVLGPSRLTGYTPGNLEGTRRRFSTESLVVPRHWDWLMGDLKRNRATFIVDTAPAGIYRWNLYPIDDYPRLREFLSAKYDAADTVDQIVTYRRRGCEATRSTEAVGRTPRPVLR